MRAPCDDPPALGARERVLAGLPEVPPVAPEVYLADVGHGDLAVADLRARLAELEVLRDDLERRLVVERERAERVEGTLAAILRLAQPSDLAGLGQPEAARADLARQAGGPCDHLSALRR